MGGRSPARDALADRQLPAPGESHSRGGETLADAGYSCAPRRGGGEPCRSRTRVIVLWVLGAAERAPPGRSAMQLPCDAPLRRPAHPLLPRVAPIHVLAPTFRASGLPSMLARFRVTGAALPATGLPRGRQRADDDSAAKLSQHPRRCTF